MHTVMWTFKVPASTSKPQLIDTINATAHTYEGIPGLIRKYYGITPDGGSLVGIYLWENVAAANAFYTPDWIAMLTKRSAASGMGNTYGRGKRRTAACCRRIATESDLRSPSPR
jgi:hypothetical protein